MSKILKNGLKLLAENPQIVGEVLQKLDANMPNIEMKTMGGEFFWKELANYRGWRVQENSIFKNCRILDPNDIRIAWGGRNAMERAFQRVKRLQTEI